MNKYIKIVLFIFLIIAFISTVSYCSAPYDTEVAKTINIRKTVSGEGYIIRRETMVEQSSKGAFEASVKDGTRVSSGSVVGVSISGNYSETLVKKLEDVTHRIEEVKKSGDFADIYSSDEARIFSALRDITKEIRENAKNQNHSLAAQNTLQLQTLLEKKYSSENSGAAQELLAELEAQKAELEAQLGGIRENVFAGASGYFYSSLDGLEQKAPEKEIFTITTSKIAKFEGTLKNYEPSDGYVGKIVDTYAWYLVASIPQEDAALLTKGTSVTLSVDEGAPLKATIEAINPDDVGTAAIVIKCTRDAAGIFEKRHVSFEICYEEYSGLYVPSAAIRIINNVKGVYVINQNETVSFRAVDILLQEEDFFIVRSSYTPPQDVPYSSLKIYDNILVNPEVLRKSELAE